MVRRIMVKQKGTWKKIIIGGVVLCAAVIAAGSFLLRKSKVKGEQGAVYKEAVVEKGTIQTSVSGTGTISYAESAEIVLPSALTIEKMLVNEGSYVKEGELLATVDSASLAVCLNEVEEAISEVDDTIHSEQSSSTSQSIKAGVSGRVKKIYAGEEDSVVTVMEEQGALMLLSADGLMAVKLQSVKNMNPGDEVTVSNGDAETTGTVETADSESVVITFDDSVFDYEEEVTVTDTDGGELGKGSAYIHQMIKVVGTDGTISSLNVVQNSNVSASTKLYTLKDRTKTAAYIQAVQEREWLVSLLDTLISIQAYGGITATAEGMVETISFVEASSSENSMAQPGEMLGEDSQEDLGEKVFVSAKSEDSGFTMMSSVESVVQDSTMSQIKETPEAPKNLAGGEGMITGTTGDMEYADSEHAAIWETCTDGSTKAAAGTWYVRFKETEETYASLAVKVEVTETAKTDGVTNAAEDAKENTVKDGMKADAGKNDTENTDSEKEQSSQNEKGGGSSQSQTVVRAQSGNNSTSEISTSENTVDSLVDTVSGFVIAKGDKMLVTMNVDELDILSMKKGLSAEVTLDAIENSVFTGEITSVSGNASGSGGVAQYPVEIVLDKTEDMLSGMNASVEVIVEQAENVLVVPLLAVSDEGGKSYVYAGYDESGEKLTDKVEVTLGRSDEINVEILSGLSEGDSVYYQIMGSDEDSKNRDDRMGEAGMPGGMEGMPPDRPEGKQDGDRQGSGQPGGSPKAGGGF